MKNLITALLFQLLFLLMLGRAAGPLVAQEDPPVKDAKSAQQQMDTTIELMSTIFIQMFQQADLSAEQLKKVSGIVDDNVKELVYSQQEKENFFDSEQRKKYNSAMQLARKVGYSEEKAIDYALRKLQLSQEQIDKYLEISRRVDDANSRMNNEIAAILTDEQKAKLPMFNAKQEAKPESIEVQLRLPNMKTDADAEVVAQSLKSIQGATNVNTDVAKQMVSFVVPNKTRLRQTIQNFVNGGKDVFKDWTVAEKTEDKPTQNSVDDAAGKKPSVTKPGAANSGGKRR